MIQFVLRPRRPGLRTAVQLPTFLDKVERILPEFKAKTEPMYTDNEACFFAKQVYGRRFHDQPTSPF